MSDTNGKIKTYKNPLREQAPTYKPYVPQYQVHGVEPQKQISRSEYQNVSAPGGLPAARPESLPLDNPRGKRAPIQQPYAPIDTVSPVGKGPVPNVGNNMEHSWSSVDGEIVDDLSSEMADLNHPMTDNNDFITDEAFGFQNGLNANDIQPNFVPRPPVKLETEIEAIRHPVESNDLMPILNDLYEDSYLLIVDGVPVCSGPKEEIEDTARSLVFGEHDMCDGNPIPIDDIIIIKRVKVKIGLFLE